MTAQILSSAPTTAPSISASPNPSFRYSIESLQDEARGLVDRGVVSRQQPIYVLCQHIPAREWVFVECELEKCEYLLRDRIGDLIGAETWEND